MRICRASGSACSRTGSRSEEHTSELQSPCNLVCRLLLEKKKNNLFASHAGVNRKQLREMLFVMRADQLLAASLAGSINGLPDVLAQSFPASTVTMLTLFS